MKPDISQGGPFSATSKYFQNKLSYPKLLLVRSRCKLPNHQTDGQEQKEKTPCSSVQVPFEHLLSLVPGNIISPLWLPSPGVSVAINEAAGERQLRAPGHSLRRSQWSQHLAAEFEPHLQNLLVPGEQESFCMAAASPPPATHLPPRART